MPANRPLKLDDIKKPDLVAGDHQFQEEEPIDAQAANTDAPADYRGAYEMVGDPPAILLLTMSSFGLAASLLPALPLVDQF